MNLREWLQQEPDIKDLVEVGEGAFTHPYETIVRKLYTLCPDGWDTQNFKHQFYTLPDGRVKVSGSVEVVVEYRIELRKIRRVLSGAATFTTTDYSNKIPTADYQKIPTAAYQNFTEEVDYGNEHFAATVKSLAIVNAVQVLGPQFGWGLNTTTLLTEVKFKKKSVRSSVKVNPDRGIRIQWNEAVLNKNMKKVRFIFGMYNIVPGENGYEYINTDSDAS
jgi:hypothetical protein